MNSVNYTVIVINIRLNLINVEPTWRDRLSTDGSTRPYLSSVDGCARLCKFRSWLSVSSPYNKNEMLECVLTPAEEGATGGAFHAWVGSLGGGIMTCCRIGPSDLLWSGFSNNIDLTVVWSYCRPASVSIDLAVLA